MEKCLFVGGSRDGELVACQDAVVEFPTYRRHEFTGVSCRHVVYKADGLSGDQILERLIEFYSPRLAETTSPE